MEQSPDDAEDGASELLFVHGGHTNRPTDLAWAGGGGGGNGGGEEWWMASAAEDNVVQVWKMSEGIYARGMKKVDDMELE
jgi:histone-binding protein RBBP4